MKLHTLTADAPKPIGSNLSPKDRAGLRQLALRLLLTDLSEPTNSMYSDGYNKSI